jgi:hypothetical protein
MFNLADYETVEERLVKYWKDHPDGRIDTTIVEASPMRFIVKASIYRTEVDAHPWTTGFAEETVSTRGVNSTSALENCETSAIGRALANAGYATKGKRPSREEMVKVATQANNEQASKRPYAEKLAEKVSLAKEDDPWTTKTVDPAPHAGDAVALVKEVLGGQTQKDIPSCRHGQMVWKTGKKKDGKPWGHMKCSYAATGEVDRCEQDVIWYQIADDGTWEPQKKWA